MCGGSMRPGTSHAVRRFLQQAIGMSSHDSRTASGHTDSRVRWIGFGSLLRYVVRARRHVMVLLDIVAVSSLCNEIAVGEILEQKLAARQSRRFGAAGTIDVKPKRSRFAAFRQCLPPSPESRNAIAFRSDRI